MSISNYFDALRAIVQPIHAAEMPRSLVPMRHLLNELGNPQTQFPSVVVTGSVGKGTTSHKIARIIQSASDEQRVGLFTGPHLHSFRERFRINGQLISQEAFVEAMKAIQRTVSHLDFAYSTFEMATALALWWFAQQNVDIAVLEVGIGGRWDAVNAVENVLAVFTPIELEHVTMLGGSLQTIAWNKAGIIQPAGWAVSPYQSPVVEDILKLEAEQKSAKLFLSRDARFVGKACYLLAEHRFIPLLPDLTGIVHRPEHLPGRLEAHVINGKWLLIDGGHTPSAAHYLRDSLEEQFQTSDMPIRLIVGMLKDKLARDFLAVFDLPNFHVTLTTAPSHRAIPPDALAAQADLQSPAVEIIPNLKDALSRAETAPESVIVVAGSLRMAAAAREFYGMLSPEELDEARATRTIFEGEDYLSKLD